MRVASHKTLMCNKLCNLVFSVVLVKRPAVGDGLPLTIALVKIGLGVKNLDGQLTLMI
jgi:hypothetical protein